MQAIERQNALGAHEASVADVEAALDSATEAVDESDAVLALAVDPLVPATAAEDLDAALDPTAAAAAEAGDLRERDPDPLSTDDIRALTADLDAAADRVAATEAELLDALDALLLATREAAPAYDEALFEAENAPRIEFREATALLEYAEGEQTDEFLAAYLDAGRVLAASHEEELAEKAGPLFDARMAAQAYARSIDGGVMLEFDWAPLVNGYGSGGSYGGTSYWVSDHGGYATITLSDSVARMWPGAGVMALVTHEVGHAILSRPDCYDLYFGSEFDLGDEEAWATAWAIGMGQTADGSGESIYGRPPDGLIALSQQCR